MKPVGFDYLRPRNLSEAADQLARSGGAKLLAGGQSLGPLLNLRLARPEILVDISRLGELKRVEETPNVWRIGGGITHAQLEDAAGRLAGAEIVSEIAAGIAYRAVRNRGTVGGSLAHADPAADWPLALAVLDAAVLIRGSNGRSRRVAADAFMVAPFTTVLEQDEILTAVEVPKRSRAVRYGYFKFCRKTGEYPESSAAIVVDAERKAARIFIGALNGAPQSLPRLAEAVARDGAAAATEDAAAEAVQAAVPTMDAIDARMHASTVRRAIQQAFRS